MDTYLFSFFVSGMFVWDSIPKKQPYKLVGMTSSFLLLRGNKETSILNVKLKYPFDPLISSLSYFIENKSLGLYLVCPLLQRVDVIGCSSSFYRSLKETGIFPREYEILQFLSVWKDRIAYLPDSGLNSDTLIQNSCDLHMRSDSPVEKDDKINMAKVGLTPEFPSFGLFDHEYNFSMQHFSKINPQKLPFCKGNRASVVLLPVGCSMTRLKPLVLEMQKKLETLGNPVLDDGRRIKCSLILDESADFVDTRLLTPGNLETLQVLFMKPSEYYYWILNSEQKYVSLESSVQVRESVFKSIQDFRFSPPPFMYVWKVFAFNSQTKLQGTLPNCDWTCVALSASATDYCKASFSYCTLLQLRNCHYFRGTARFDYFNSLESSLFRLPFTKHISITTYVCEASNPFEKSLDKLFKDKPKDQFMATMGFLRKQNSGEVWDSKLFNIRMRKTGGYIFSDFIEECFDGYALDTAKQMLSTDALECCVCCTNEANTLLENCGHAFCQVCLCTMLDTASTSVDGHRQNGKIMETCPTCRTLFCKESMVQFKQYKTTRRKLKEDVSLTRKRALSVLLKSPIPTQKSSRSSSGGSELVVDMDTKQVCVEDKIGYTDQDTLLIVPYDAVRDTLLSWFPQTPCVSLQSLGDIQSTVTQQFSRLLLVSPLMNVEGLHGLHHLIQKHGKDSLDITVLALTIGQHTEEASWISSLHESYGSVEESTDYGSVEERLENLII
jgi:hypothetical protein